MTTRWSCVASLVAGLVFSAVAARGEEKRPVRPRAEKVRKLDTNKDGTLSPEEIKAGMEAHAKQRGEMAAKAFQKLDTNGDGVLSPDEFKKLGEHFRPEPKHKERPNLELQFKKLDTNKDGKLSGDEFKKVADAAFDKLDANHDGAVSAEELKQHRKEHGGNEHKP